MGVVYAEQSAKTMLLPYRTEIVSRKWHMTGDLLEGSTGIPVFNLYGKALSTRILLSPP